MTPGPIATTPEADLNNNINTTARMIASDQTMYDQAVHICSTAPSTTIVYMYFHELVNPQLKTEYQLYFHSQMI